MNAAAPSSCWRWRRARNCTTSARARRSATGAGRKAACCGRGDDIPPILQGDKDPMNQKNLLEVDWSKIPAPADDGAAAHLVGMTIPQLSRVATDYTSETMWQ